MTVHYQILTCGEVEVYRLIARLCEHSIYPKTVTVFYQDESEVRSLKAFCAGYDVELKPSGLGEEFHVGKARNRMLSSIPVGDWAVQLDSDELVSPEFDGRIRLEIRRAERMKLQAIAIPRVNIVYDGDAQRIVLNNDLSSYLNYPDFQVRVMRNDGNQKVYENPHHPQRTCASMETKLSDLVIIHHKSLESYGRMLGSIRKQTVRPSYLAHDSGIFDEVYINNVYKMACHHPMKHMPVIDVGAHIGCFVLRAADYGCSNIHAFEADPLNFERLAANASLYDSRITKINISNVAVWRSDVPVESLSLNAFNRNDGNSNTGGGSVASSFGSIKVPAKSFDSIVEGIGTDVFFLKLDCEGSEFPILYTSKMLGRIHNIALEWHIFEFGEHAKVPGHNNTPEALAAFLSGNGFSVTWDRKVETLGMMYATRQ